MRMRTLKSDDSFFPYFFKYASELSSFIFAIFMAIMTIQVATQNAGYVVLAEAEITEECSHIVISHLKG